VRGGGWRKDSYYLYVVLIYGTICLQTDSNPDPKLMTDSDPDPNLQVISDPAGFGYTTLQEAADLNFVNCHRSI
jgi:hypothetical protein